MAGLLIDIVFKWLVASALTSAMCFAFPLMLSLGDSASQAFGVLCIYMYCVLALFTGSAHQVFHVLSVPVIAQFLQLFQKYSFTPSANSIWRLLPFLLLDLYLILFILRSHIQMSRFGKVLLLIWIVINAFLIAISPNAAGILIGAPVLYLVTIPLIFIYLNTISLAVDFRLHLERSLCLLYVIFGFGTFGLVFFGAGYKGSDNLLVTRNISDTNVTMAYFILLWPFALLYARRLRLNVIASLLLAAILLAIVILSFSRGAALIILPYLTLTLLFSFSIRQWLIFSAFVIIIFLNANYLANALEEKGLAYSWQLRVQDYDKSVSGYRQLQQSSGRAAIHETARQLFLKSPAVGHGIGSFEKLGPGYREAHSLFFTWLAEEGLFGTAYKYALLLSLFSVLFTASIWDRKMLLMLFALLFYLIFNHTVGSVFVIIPARSLTINCFAPVLLLCLYFYAKAPESLPG